MTARGIAFQFASKDQDVHDIGERLGVRYACYGSVQVESSRAWVQAGLALTETREEIWADIFEAPLDGLIRTQELIAPRIVSALQLELEKTEQNRSLLVPSENLDAWSAFHRGCWSMFRFQKDQVELAGRINPSYAIALYTLGWVNMHLGRNELTIEQIGAARKLSPLDPLTFAMMGVQALSMALSGRTSEAADLAIESLENLMFTTRCTPLPR